MSSPVQMPNLSKMNASMTCLSTRFVHRTNMRSWISEYTPFETIDALGDYLNCVIIGNEIWT